ncbi:MAG: magnesium-translocating P-type ATPase, partial [Clostridiales bacterium]|nr:magnesium-translocating P-type ATPase [Clostridiales bacterium]
MPKKVKVNPSVQLQAQKIKRRLLNAAQKKPETLLIQYDNTWEGYDSEQIEDSQLQYGENKITQQKKESVWKRLFEAFVNPFTVVLFVLACVSLFTQDFPAVIIVLSMVLISGLLRFLQELRSGVAAEKLTEMVETTVAVQRKFEIENEDEEEEEVSERREIPLDELVVGDIVYLAAGDMIPADVRILQAKDLFVSQSSLTGESEPVEKFGHEIAGKAKNPLDLNNLAFMGSNVISGTAVALALAVGDDTVFGEIARQLQTKKTVTSFEKGITSVSWVLIRFMAAMVPVVFFISALTTKTVGDMNRWMSAALFALSIAVGLTPEMLPMLVSANLAKGAVSMSKKRVIVKDLNSIQNFGAMDILCTDKTGTLTQDKVILEYHLNIDGQEDPRVLRHAFLNSYYQTGLKNLMDLSIIEHANDLGMRELYNNYSKIDEIPFDFNRRRMSVVVEDQSGKTQMITKGAIEEMLNVCTFVDYSGKVEPITKKIKAEVLEVCRKFNDDGLRVLGLAQKTNPAPAGAFSISDESEMVLIGYLAFLDPPKESAEDAILALQEYGVTVKVLTGDNDAVTRTVCKQVGLDVDQILLGSDIEEMDEETLAKAVEDVDVFAKLSPSQKARIVTALRGNGHTVGFMGDGINDAAAMRAADV